MTHRPISLLRVKPFVKMHISGKKEVMHNFVQKMQSCTDNGFIQSLMDTF